MIAVLLLLSAVASLSDASSARNAHPGPLSVVQRYLAALNDRDGSAVCVTFSPQLRALVRSESLAVHPSCAVDVEEHFPCSWAPHCWAGAWIARVGQIAIDQSRQIAAVNLTLAHRYICKDPRPAGTRCEAGVIRRPEIIYLLRDAGGWQIVKPGLVFTAPLEPDPLDVGEWIYHPPGDPTTMERPAAIGAPDFECPLSAASTTDTSNDVVENESGGARVDAPWLDIRALRVSHVDARTDCFTIELAGPPRPDAIYSIYLGARHERGVEKEMEVEIDGVGDPHVRIEGRGAFTDPRIARSLPHIGLVGSSLEIEAANPRSLTTQSELFVIATSQSLQSQEALIAHPVIGEDHAPNYGCLEYPSGRLIAGTCHLPEP